MTISVSGLAGLHEVSTINRAVGILIAEGHPDQTHTELHRQAAAGLTPHRCVTRLPATLNSHNYPIRASLRTGGSGVT